MRIVFLVLTTYCVCLSARAENSFDQDAREIYAEFTQAKLDYGLKFVPSVFQVAKVYEEMISDTGEQLSKEERKTHLSPTPLVAFNHPLVRKLVALLTADCKTDIEKVVVLHNFVLWRITHVTYFQTMATSASLASAKGKLNTCLNSRGQMRNLEECGLTQRQIAGYKTGNQILQMLYVGLHNCAGYAALFEALARAAGIPTRIALTPQSVEKDGPSFHLWNQVYVKGQWLVVDPTFDDGFDHGEGDSVVPVAYNFFLIKPEKAAELDPKFHKTYIIQNI